MQSTCAPVNDNLMQLLIMIDAMKRASAGCITAVVPYFGYARQTAKQKPATRFRQSWWRTSFRRREPTASFRWICTRPRFRGFFNIPVDHLLGAPILGRYMKERVGQDEGEYVVVSPDLGSVTRSRNFAAAHRLPSCHH